MKKIFALIMTMAVLLTACGSEPAEKYPPQRMDFGGGDYAWNYYNDEGQRIKCESYTDEVMTEILYFEYDENGNVIKLTTTDTQGNEMQRRETTYKNGQKFHEIIYMEGVMKLEDFYDESGNCYLSKSYKDGELDSYTESFYDENNSATMSAGHRADGTIRWINEYGKDEDGNFVTVMSEYDENEELLKMVKKTSVKNGFREEILFEK